MREANSGCLPLWVSRSIVQTGIPYAMLTPGLWMAFREKTHYNGGAPSFKHSFVGLAVAAGA